MPDVRVADDHDIDDDVIAADDGLLDGERQLALDAFDNDHDTSDSDLQMHDLGRYGVSGFTGLGLAWAALAVAVAVFGAPVTAGPSLVFLVLWLVVWVGAASAVNAVLSLWQRRSLAGRLLPSSTTSAGGEGTPTAIPGMRP